MCGKEPGGRTKQRHAETRGVSSHCCLLNFSANIRNTSFTQASWAGALLGFSRGRIAHAGSALADPQRVNDFSSLVCQKRQALICKARRPYQEPSYLQGSRAASKGSRRCLYFFHFPACI